MDAALRPLAPGPLTRIGNGIIEVTLAPQAGGRIAQIACDGVEWLRSHEDGDTSAIAWGCYPMLPWAGRLRGARFDFEGRRHQLPANLGAHAIHGLGFQLPWRMEAHTATQVGLSLALPRDARWPFGGVAHQRIVVENRSLRLELSLQAEELAMPRPVLGWHPWFHKPERLDFAPTRYYPRDAEGIPTAPQGGTPAGPWDDCFIHERPVNLHRAGRTLRLCSSCDHWVIYDMPANVTCVEPQTGPPDAFNLWPARHLAPGELLEAWCLLEW